jgi:SOS-response transcriptional repressor LexA
MVLIARMVKLRQNGFGEALRRLRERTGDSIDTFAKRAGYRGGSGYQRFEYADMTLAQVRVPKRQAFAKALFGRGDPPIGIADLRPLLDEPVPDLRNPGGQATAYSMLGLPIPDDLKVQVNAIEVQLSPLPIIGEVQASYWMPSAPSFDAPMAETSLPFILGYPADVQYGLRVIGPSMNKIIPEGAEVVCVRYDSGLIRYEQGSIVHVQRERAGEVEWTLKRFKWGDDGRGELWPESHDPRFVDPIALNGDRGGHEARVLIVGVVIKVVTDPKNL